MACGVLNCPGPVAGLAARLHPVAVLVELRDARVDVAVADVDVALRVPRHVGRLAEPTVLRRSRRRHVFPRLGAVGRLLAAAEDPLDATRSIEADDHVRALVDRPDVVVPVDAHGVGERPPVEVLADLANELAGWRELQELRRHRAEGGPGGAARPGKHEDPSLRVDRDARHFTEVDIVRQLQEVGHRLELDDGSRRLRRLTRRRHRHGRQRERGREESDTGCRHRFLRMKLGVVSEPRHCSRAHRP